MPKRPSHTLLFIKSDLIARADFGAAPSLEPLGFWSQVQNSNVRLFYAIKAALEFGPKCGKKVWVLAEEFWTQTMSLPASAVAGLGREQIRKAIGFDVEALTGVAGSESAIGFCKADATDEFEHFWVTQIASTPRTQIQKTIEAAGGSLAGLVHPGGLPAPIDPKQAASSHAVKSWRRVEVWKDTTVCVTGGANGEQRVRVINGELGNDAWRASVLRWARANDAEISEWLGPQGPMAGEALGDASRPWTSLPALNGDVLKAWLARWAADLSSGSKHVPLVEATLPAVFSRNYAAAVAAITVLAALGCGWRGWWLYDQQNRANAATAAQAPQKQLDSLETKIKSLRADLDKRRKQTGAHPAAKLAAIDVERERTRISKLLMALAEQCNANLVIDHITAKGAGVMLIEGKCAPASAAHEYPARLATALAAVDWEITPAQMSLPEGSDGAYAAFSFSASPAKVPTPAPNIASGTFPGTAKNGGRK